MTTCANGVDMMSDSESSSERLARSATVSEEKESSVVQLDKDHVLAVRRWKEVFEKSDARKLKHLSWISMPTGFESNGLQMMFDDFGARAVEMYGAWSLLLKVAAVSVERGRLGGSQGRAYSSAALSRMMMGCPVEVIDELISWCVHKSGWLEVVRVGESDDLGESPRFSENLRESPKISENLPTSGDDSKTPQITASENFRDSRKFSENLPTTVPDRTEPDITEQIRAPGKGARSEIFPFCGYEYADSVAEAIKDALRITNRLGNDGRLACFRTACWLSARDDREQLLREIVQLMRSERPKRPWGFLFGVCRKRNADAEGFSRRWDATNLPTPST